MASQLWAWLVPLVGALTVLSFVLLTTPPGFESIVAVLFSPPRGLTGDAAAYALGAAASLALASLVGLGLLCAAISTASRRLTRNG